MRSDYSASWAFGIQATIKKVVKENFPRQVRLWPLLQGMNFEGYRVRTDYFIIILRDTLSGIPVGNDLAPFPYEDHPPLPLSLENVSAWPPYLIKRFSLSHEDLAMVLPLHDSGKFDAAADFALYSEVEKEVYRYQLQFWIERQSSTLPSFVSESPAPATPATYILSGTNNRITINSADNSVNVVNQTPPEIFQHLMEAVRGTKADPELVAEMIAAVEEMQRSYEQGGYFARYQAFISLLADHFQVFGPVVIPYLPTLTQLLNPS